MDLESSHLDQIFKRGGFNINIGFSGTASPSAATGAGVADVSKEARKAYFEIDSNNGNADVDANGTLTGAAEFIITGNKGSHLFRFDVGASMGQIASAISSMADSTGVDASLVFASNMTDKESGWQTPFDERSIGGARNDFNAYRQFQNVVVFFDDNGAVAGFNAGWTEITGKVVGRTTDGDGRIWIKVTGDSTYEVYKDRSLSAESLVGKGVSSQVVTAINNSGLGAMNLVLNAGHAGEVFAVALHSIEGDNPGMKAAGGMFVNGAGQGFDYNRSLVSGVRLGRNTDGEGKVYLRTVMTDSTHATIYAYNDSSMDEASLVAKSADAVRVGRAGGGAFSATVILNEVMNDDRTAGTGLGIALSLRDNSVANSGIVGVAGDEITGEIAFTRLGVRISSGAYGSGQFIRLQQQQGAIWQYYKAGSTAPVLVNASANTVTVQQDGQDATLSVNGRRMISNGLDLNLSTQDVQARLRFNEGKVGSTTIAQVGYNAGTVYSRAGFLENSATGNVDTTLYGGYLTNPGHVTTEQLDHFRNGMQFQLGEGAGDQERIVYGIESMDVANLGVTGFTGRFDPSKAVVETRQLSLQDVLGGGLASLAVDPVKALSIVDKAIADVSNLRARLGATQANLLQTNANSLQVAIENIQKTESAIRDADMAAETTRFTRNQIMTSAGTSMLAQANVVSQSVLQLLG